VPLNLIDVMVPLNKYNLKDFKGKSVMCVHELRIMVCCCAIDIHCTGLIV
jgi:hypothetical protein